MCPKYCTLVHCFHLVGMIQYIRFYSSVLTTQVTLMVILPEGVFRSHSDHYDLCTSGVSASLRPSLCSYDFKQLCVNLMSYLSVPRQLLKNKVSFLWVLSACWASCPGPMNSPARLPTSSHRV